MRQYQNFKCDNSINSLDKFKKFVKCHDCPELTLNLSSLNIFDAAKFVLLSSAYHYQKYPSGKIKYQVESDDIKNLVLDFAGPNLEFV